MAAFLKETGTITRESQILFAAFREHPYGYVIFDKNYLKARKTILDCYQSNGVFSIGRYGGWTYNSMEDAMIDDIEVTQKIG